jgi:hypothetical protein
MSRGLEASVIELLRLWSQELPAAIHRNGVFVGPPDREGSHTLSAAYSEAKDLVGGSVLGAPAYSEGMRRLLEGSPHQEQWDFWDGRDSATEKHLVTPLRSAIKRTGPMWRAYITEVARSGGDWYGAAVRRGCANEHIARVYANEAFRRLWKEYRPEKPVYVPDRPKGRRYSDDVPWTEMSESQKAAEDAA